MKHFFKKLWLKHKRGFSCCDTWNLDGVFAKYLVKGLKAFKQDYNSCPSDLTFEEWEKTINSMIWSFWYRCSETYWDDDWNDEKSSLARRKKYQNGLDLFAKYFNHLWI
jgi:hypothetical protein